MFLFWSHSKSVLLISLVIWTISEWLLIQHTLFFDKHSVFLASQPQHAYCFSYSSLKSCLQYARASLGGGGGVARSHGSPTSISELNKVQKHFSFKHQEYCFLQVFRKYTDQKFHDFSRVCYIFWTIYGGFSFFLTA